MARTSNAQNEFFFFLQMATRSRKFFVTYWSPKEIMWDEKIMRYACKCDDHCSEEHEGKWHGHYYVYYKNPRTWNDIKKYYGNDCHIEIPHSNSGAIKYILGEGDHAESKTNIVEFGDMPCDNGKHLTYREAIQMTKEEIKELPMADALMVMKCQKIEKENEKIDVDDWKKEVEVVFISGPSGCGKTEMAKQIIRESSDRKFSLVKYDGNFWHGATDGKGTAVYDDFRDSHMKGSEFINFIDYNKQIMNIKGSNVLNQFNRIIITSVQKLENIYSGMTGEPREQWTRRVRYINMWPPKEEDDDEALFREYFG